MPKENPFIKKAKAATISEDNPFSERRLAQSRQKALEKGVKRVNELKDNPFLKKPKGKELVKAQGPPVELDEKGWALLKTEARKMLLEKGIRVGMVVKTTWEYDRAYGEGTADHTGTVVEVGDFLESVSDRQGRLRLPITRIKEIEVVT